MVTAKIVCQSKVENGEGDDRQVTVTFVPDYADGRNEEWALYTPGLSLTMGLKGAVADRFEKGRPYTLQFLEDAAAEYRMDFGQALAALKNGSKVTRDGWNGAGMWLALQVPDANSKMSRPYVYMSTVDGQLVPWVASQSDLLAEDWHTA